MKLTIEISVADLKKHLSDYNCNNDITFKVDDAKYIHPNDCKECKTRRKSPENYLGTICPTPDETLVTDKIFKIIKIEP